MRKEEYKNGRRRSGNAPESPQEARSNADTIHAGIVDDIIVKSKEGKTITRSEIENSIYRYTSTLHEPNDIYNNKPMLFNGLLEYIYRHNIRYILPSNTIRYDYELLDNIFINIYINLCYTFSYVPMVTIFCNHLVHIDITYIYNIKDGIRLMDNIKVNPNIVRYIQKWISICNSDLFTHIAQTNSIGSIFVAKVKGFSDQPQQISVNINADTPKLDLKQISQAAKTGHIAPPEE